jgi:hypothetical protein
MTIPPRIELHLGCRVVPARREEFLAFLHEAIPFYEAPGGIAVRLLHDAHDDHRFIEVILYDSQVDYDRDQERVESDPIMKEHLTRWRALLAEAPSVAVYRLAVP